MFDNLIDMIAGTIKSESTNKETPKTNGKYSNFNEYIQMKLDERARQDHLFAKMYAKENKSIDECVRYIVGEMYKKCVRSGNFGYAVNDCEDNSDLIGMAVHYYCEDDIEINNIGGSASVQNVETPKQEYKPKMEVQINKNPKPSKQQKQSVCNEDLFAEYFKITSKK